MANLKSLAKDTAIYGLSSIVGRFLNYLLVPLYTAKISAESGGYGVITEIYSYVALILVLLTFGMETTFFRFVNKGEHDPMRVYSTTLIAVGSVAICFVVFILLFITPISNFLDYSEHPSYVYMMAICVAIDAFLCIPFAYLRYKKKAIKFATLKLAFIFMNIVLNLAYFIVFPHFIENFRIDVGYVFGINLFCSAVSILFFYKELWGFSWVFDKALMKKMWHYAWPILILGIAGILNQTADKIIFPRIVTGDLGKEQLGIYGACFKIAMIMAMITQAFRYAYEPFVFGKSRDKDNRETYAKAMKYFVVFTLLAFLIVMGYMDILKYIIAPDYWQGLKVVPIVMVAEIMMGIYFNLSFWYKLTDRTIWGAYFSGAGCAVLILTNIIFIPYYGYMACAWAGVAGYGTAMVLSYVFGQKYYPINYPLKSIAIYVGIATLFYIVMAILPEEWSAAWRIGINTLLILLFIGHFLYHDIGIEKLPVIGKRSKK